MATLYELSEKYLQLLYLAESGTFEDNEEAYLETVEALDEAIEDKAEGYAIIDLELKSSADKLSNEILRLQERKKSLERNRRRLKESLKDQMKVLNKKKLKTDKFTIWIQNNPMSVDVINQTQIPDKYFVEQEPKLNKKDLIKDLKGGVEIKGAKLKQTDGLRFK